MLTPYLKMKVGVMEKIFSLLDEARLLHIIVNENDFEKRNEIIPDENFLQLATIDLSRNQEFAAHRHLLKNVNFSEFWAQESWVVIKGSVEVTYFDIDDTEIFKRVISAGEASITLQGGHAYKVLEDAKVYEFKTGPYFGRDADKIFI